MLLVLAFQLAVIILRDRDIVAFPRHSRMEKSFTRIDTPGRRRREVSTSDLLEAGPGKRYPKLFMVLAVFLVFLMLNWLPSISHKSKLPLAFVWPSAQTRDARVLVSPTLESTIIKPKVCDSVDPSSFPYLLIVVCSAVTNFDARTAIRNSWALDQEVLKGVRVVFLVGQEVNNTHQDELIQENNVYGDMLQEGFIDTYANLTVKSVMLLKWFNINCDISNKLRTEYVLKTDDDIYINIPQLYELVRTNRKPNLLVGTLICNAVPIKDPHNKWFVPRYMFHEKKYPNYLSGTGYLMNRVTAAKLYASALATPVFHLEDIYITGILSRNVGIRPVDYIGFSYVRRELKACVFQKSISTHHIKHQEMLDMYAKLQKTKAEDCPKLKTKALRPYGAGRCIWPRTKTGNI